MEHARLYSRAYIVHGGDLLSEVPGGDLQDVCVGRGGVGGEGVAPPRGSVGGVQQLLYERRVPQVSLLSQHLPPPLHLHM
jgi:hypothetical protein